MSAIGHVLHDNPLLRDFAIAAAILVVLVVVNIFTSIRRHGKRKRQRAERARIQALPGGADPIPGVAELASSKGWTGPTTDPQFDNQATDYTHEMSRNLWGYSRAQTTDTSYAISPDNTYTNIFHGQLDGRAFTIGNTRINVKKSHFSPGVKGDTTGSVCTVKLPITLPPLFVNLKHCAPFTGFLMKHVDLESEQFNRTFSVATMNPKYAVDVITPQVMEILLTRDDWVFAYELDTLICVCASGLHTAEDFSERADAMAKLVSLIPHFVADDDALKMPTLPDGTVLGPHMSKADQQKAYATIMAMSPEEREAFARKTQIEGMQSVANMFGKHIDEGALEAAVDKNMERQRKEHPEYFPDVPNAPDATPPAPAP